MSRELAGRIFCPPNPAFLAKTGGFWSKFFDRPNSTFLSAIILHQMRHSDPKSEKLFNTPSSMPPLHPDLLADLLSGCGSRLSSCSRRRHISFLCCSVMNVPTIFFWILASEAGSSQNIVPMIVIPIVSKDMTPLSFGSVTVTESNRTGLQSSFLYCLCTKGVLSLLKLDLTRDLNFLTAYLMCWSRFFLSLLLAP